MNEQLRHVKTLRLRVSVKHETSSSKTAHERIDKIY